MIKEIIKFGAPWCQSCISANTALEQLSAINPDIIITHVNIEEESDLSERYKVRSLPTLVFLNINGKEVGRHTGRITVQELIKIVNGNGI